MPAPQDDGPRLSWPTDLVAGLCFGVVISTSESYDSNSTTEPPKHPRDYGQSGPPLFLNAPEGMIQGSPSFSLT